MNKSALRTELDALMLPIPAGSIALRDDRIQKNWEVEINAFRLAKTVVSQELYQAIMGENPAQFVDPQRPVENVSWWEAIQFCNALSRQMELSPCYSIDENKMVTYQAKANGYRLASEAEWQYACQAGSTELRYGPIDDIAWFKENSQGQSQPVGLKEPNAWGLYDMLGNVWEWCSDLYDEEVYGSYRIIRGGGWCDPERGILATNRRRSHPHSFKIDDLGFRIAQNL
ncbi:formylglycine-generating enzyme family protein [Croceimicrobium hydrocarbonivorans]|uniref:SUMF1/EgtB/PvdO family nonheme iron enzyme n=1 Tax=Croceimicrobium hydrocarbonivorans TaxID=2761580 RepID=A0A7H0VIS8_9FLAO|nr:SUMF1/EgtB/PvdO family nonheme iron enzyme [Croceimicrobium hydrocarbonivorans]QNR25626.1 SUMF1/EgtB/PvdO family nonheme iron enzyme [Croceimicrobium hydrocarbonivorans]